MLHSTAPANSTYDSSTVNCSGAGWGEGEGEGEFDRAKWAFGVRPQKCLCFQRGWCIGGLVENCASFTPCYWSSAIIGSRAFKDYYFTGSAGWDDEEVTEGGVSAATAQQGCCLSSLLRRKRNIQEAHNLKLEPPNPSLSHQVVSPGKE